MNTHELLEQLDDMARLLVETQLKIAIIQNNLEKLLYKDTESVKGSVEYSPGPPQQVKITVPIYPPKIMVHPKLLYRKHRSAQSTYSQVRDFWFATIGDVIINNRNKMSGFKTMRKAIVWYTFFFPDKRIHDVDNHSIKIINDVLVDCNLIADDDYRSMKNIVEGDFDEQNPGTEILIIEDTGQLSALKKSLSVLT